MDTQKTNRSRREFLKTGVAGIAGLASYPALQQETKKDKFIYRTLGKTGLKLPIISMGSMINPGLVKAALDEGTLLIDTSSEHGNGNNERIIGKIIKKVPRDSYVIATSTGVDKYKDRRTSAVRKNVKADAIKKSFEASLKRLNLDYVDFYYLAAVWDRNSTLFEPFVSAMEKLKREGKTKFVGVTTHMNEPEVLRAAVESKVFDVVLTAYNFRQQHRKEVKEAIAYAAQAGLGIIAMKTQAGVYWDNEKKNMINMKAALKWVLQDKNVHTTVPAFNTFNELREAYAIMENLPLTPDEKKDLRLGDEMGFNGLYCQQCEKCIPQCKHKIEIPALIRTYMYAYGYRNPAKAKETFDQIDFSHTVCEDCRECTVECSMGFNVKERIMDIARIRIIPDEFLA